jgi:glycosyltransferase involved in cell wall biosynthesis
MLSIIIPTSNEEKYLPLLFNSIKKQNFSAFEIILGDNNSKDKTTEIARNFGCKIAGGGLPARGKNEAVKCAKGDALLFLDADIILPEDFLEESLKEITKRKLEVASWRLRPISDNKFYPLAFEIFYNIPMVILERILPHGATAIFIKRDLFEKLEGFDEEIKLAEDHDFTRRAAKMGKFGVVRSSRVMISDRRFKKDGLFRTALKYLLCELHMIFLGPVKSDFFDYKFNHYDNNNGSSSDKN